MKPNEKETINKMIICICRVLVKGGERNQGWKMALPARFCAASTASLAGTGAASVNYLHEGWIKF